MPEFSFTDLLSSALAGLLATVEETAEHASATGLRVEDVRIEIPALLRMTADPRPEDRLQVALPELRRSSQRGLVGRVEIQIARDDRET